MEKLKIAICDDELIFAEKLANVISEYMNAKQIKYEIDIYKSGREFINLGMDMMQYKIVFLDINMEEVDGIETAKTLRQLCKDTDTYIVFVTAFIKYIFEGYKVEVTRYLMKNDPNFEDTVYESIDAILNKIQSKYRSVKYEFNEGMKIVPYDKIVYIESDLHKLHFGILEDELCKYTLYETLNSIEQNMLEEKFIRIHQSYLVNYKYIKKIQRYEVVLINEMKIPIAKTRYMDVKERYAEYKGEM